MRKVWLQALRPGDRADLGTFQEGATIELRVGDSVRLRMIGSESMSGDRERYPSTTFRVDGRHRELAIDTNTEVGNVTLTGRSPHNGNGATPVKWEITEPWSMDAKLRRGQVFVRVLAAAPAPLPAPVTPRGVTLFADADFRGASLVMTADNADLGRSGFGNDRLSSLRVEPGCRVTLFTDTNFRGRQTVVVGNLPSLSGTDVGNDSASSLRIECGGSSATGAAVLFSDEGFLGRSVTLAAGDYAELRGEVGNDNVGSLRVTPGCVVDLFEDDGFRGRAASFDRDTASLRGTAIGNDRASSVRVRCP